MLLLESTMFFQWKKQRGSSKATLLEFYHFVAVSQKYLKMIINQQINQSSIKCSVIEAVHYTFIGCFTKFL